MGTKIKAKYEGMCKICGDEWNVGSDIFYQKDPKAICGSKECFEEQGGKFTPFKSQTSFSGFRTPIITKLPEVDISDDVKKITEYWDQFFVVAHHKTKAVYPSEDVNGDRFGQIRSKMMDQLMSLIQMIKE
jgi:hypothetical protein|tara:strand:- start:1434 stop:1826 length:393 start_codon:yes stop_codon:yes gene_type:complete